MVEEFEAGLTGFGIADKGAVRVAFDNGVTDTDHGILLAFVGGSSSGPAAARPPSSAPA